MGLLIFCCPRALVTNITELTITSYAWMRPFEEQVVATEQPPKRSKFPNIERLMRAEWACKQIKESIPETGEGGYCIVCFDSFEHVKESKLIPCGHKSICPKCAIKLIAMRGKNTTCPQCRHVVWKYVVMEDDIKKKPNKNTIVLEDLEDKGNDKGKESVKSSKEANEKEGDNSKSSVREQKRQCIVCFRPFFPKNGPTINTFASFLEGGIRVKESRLYPCGHGDICSTCAALITLREINRECPQCSRFVRRYEETERI